ncbi:outer membrane lipid asymmetry maintenance protein MlaD [Alphaproteobacteria bacterium]|nr:outer membrane lipid asymmetry maintenance protein MlaD [Alphaproteobacteria bacterium]MDB4106572.1 outer membrane lipid asymmetry maintenance protein MlaD [bacterium]MDC0147463.1 outer membrane lipid asymmetry maintenance protein MlaD [Alphaproteobacteria bacterium]
MLKDNLVETLVGAVVVIIAGLFVAYGYSVTESGSSDGYEVSAQFNRVDGLTIGSDVRMSGIKVGAVVSLDLDPESFYANVVFLINNGVTFPDDTSAKITSEGLLGGNYVSLSPGGSEDVLEADGEILYTQGSVDLIELVSQALFSAGDGESGKQ